MSAETQEATRVAIGLARASGAVTVELLTPLAVALLDERDAAIRRAQASSEADELLASLPEDVQTDLMEIMRTLSAYRRAALRSQESQKPPETRIPTISEVATTPDTYRVLERMTRPSEPPETEDR